MKKRLGRFKRWIAGAISVMLAVFALQNMGPVDLTFLLWTVETRRIVIIVISFTSGLAIGWLIKENSRVSGKKNNNYTDET